MMCCAVLRCLSLSVSLALPSWSHPFSLFTFPPNGELMRVCCIHRPFLQSISGRLNNQPVLGLLGGVLEDYQYLWDNYYFSSATL